MDIQGLSLASVTLSNANLNTQFGMAMLDKSLDSTENTGSAMISMMERSVNPNIGSNIDVRL